MKDVVHIDNQISIVEDNIIQARNLMIAMMSYNVQLITKMMYERVSGVGLDDYGDKSFNKTEEQLIQECLEEFADALFYSCLIVAKRAGKI